MTENKVQVHPWWKNDEDVEKYVYISDAVNLHYSRSSLIRKIKKGKITGFKVFGRWLIKIS